MDIQVTHVSVNRRGQPQRESRRLAGPSLQVGRGTQCQIHLPDPRVALQHARIEVSEAGAAIDAEARRHGWPPALLRAVAWQESRGRAGAVSSKGALGVMQIMPATAAFLGVDPLDVKDNLRGGAMFLRQQLDRFGSVPLALAAYNAGPEAVKRFGGIPPYRETRLYVASILARLPPETVQAPLLIPAGDALR